LKALDTFVEILNAPSSFFNPQAMLAGYGPEGATGRGSLRMQAWGPTNTHRVI